MTQESRTPSPLWPNRPTPPEHDKQRPGDNSRAVHDNGTFTPASAAPASRAALNAAFGTDQPPFATVRRGYDPTAVDARLAQLDESVAALRSALQESERRRAMAEQHAVAVEEEIRVVRSGMFSAPAPDTGFGARAERMLRLAESEAEQVRATAQRTASEVTERALSDAEQHRHDVRQQLIAESARAEELAARLRTAGTRGVPAHPDQQDAGRRRSDPGGSGTGGGVPPRRRAGRRRRAAQPDGEGPRAGP